MPALQGGAPQEVVDALNEDMIQNGRFNNTSQALEHCVIYTLSNKYNREFDS